MNRREFTKLVAELILQMRADGHEPVLDYALRSASEQNRLFKAGASKCDGYKRISAHQRARAVDIYFVVNDKEDFDYKQTKSLAIRYHQWWQERGGKALIGWDLGHYEG